MGNTVTLIKVHHRKGIAYYRPPMRVRNICKDHPGYVVVSMSGGKRSILSSDLELQPGRSYYLISPDQHFSTTAESQIPGEHPLSCCPKRCSKLYRIVGFYYASTKSLFTMLIPHRKRLKAISSAKIQNQEDFGGGQQPQVRKSASLLMKDDCTEGPKLVTSPQGPDATAAGALKSRERPSLKDVAQDVQRPTSDKSMCSPLLKLGQGMVEKLEEMSSCKRLSSHGVTAKTGNTVSESEKERTCHCIPRKSLKKLEEGGVISQALSKEKWLDDMIRGAENEWHRIRLRQAFLIEDAESKGRPCCQPPLWGLCLPSSTGGCSHVTSFPRRDAKKDEDLDNCCESRSGVSLDDSSDMVEVNRDHQLERKVDPQLTVRGAYSARSIASKVLQSEIEEVGLGLGDESPDGKRKHPLWLKMDEIERQFLLTSSPSTASPSIPTNVSQKSPEIDAPTRPHFRPLNFSRVDRG